MLYVSNRGPDTISAFDISGDRPTLVAEVPTGAGPRHFELHGSCLVSGGQSGDVVSGRGVPGPAVTVPLPAPACVVAQPIGTVPHEFRRRPPQ